MIENIHIENKSLISTQNETLDDTFENYLVNLENINDYI